jgi:EAL domain-containing protein (putative c-di-GMP-specific phosphodiesterase class I)
VQETLSEPFTLAGAPENHLTVTASIGIATTARSSAEEFLHDADIAMHQAKWNGKNRYVLFESGMQDAVHTRMKSEMDLRNALMNDEFLLLYQPTFDLRDMSPTGVEALIRWKHPTRAIVLPDDFIPLLEASGLIIEVGKWVLEEACRQGAAWRAAGYPIGMAVNVSGRQLDTDAFVTDVQDALSKSGLDPSALTVEITETTLMRNVEETTRRLTAIRELGVRIAIDDFGTGYSSLAALHRFPVDALKIDRSFVASITGKAGGSDVIVRSTVALAHSLGLHVIAEGIETASQLRRLRTLGCEYGQGFLFDALKIARSFIARITESSESKTLVHTLVQLGKALSIETLAEGIEQQQELSMLQAEQCDSGQGFLLARPLDVVAVETFLQTWASGPAPGEPSPPQPIGRRAVTA